MDTLLKEINPVLPPGRNHCPAHLSGATLPLGLSCTTANWTFFALTRLFHDALLPTSRSLNVLTRRRREPRSLAVAAR
jgi:hypothetical protein